MLGMASNEVVSRVGVAVPGRENERSLTQDAALEFRICPS